MHSWNVSSFHALRAADFGANPAKGPSDTFVMKIQIGEHEQHATCEARHDLDKAGQPSAHKGILMFKWTHLLQDAWRFQTQTRSIHKAIRRKDARLLPAHPATAFNTGNIPSSTCPSGSRLLDRRMLARVRTKSHPEIRRSEDKQL
jgi:hypothetical protein